MILAKAIETAATAQIVVLGPFRSDQKRPQYLVYDLNDSGLDVAAQIRCSVVDTAKATSDEIQAGVTLVPTVTINILSIGTSFGDPRGYIPIDPPLNLKGKYIAIEVTPGTDLTGWVGVH